MRIDAVERLAYWKSCEADAAANLQVWRKRGDSMAPGAVKRASDWNKSVIELVKGWQEVVKCAGC